MDPVIVITPEAETTPEPEAASSERILGQLETETEHLSEEVEEAQETAETAQELAEISLERANQTEETAWATRADLEQFKAEILEMVQSEVLEDLEDPESGAVEVELPEPEATPEAVTEVSSERTGILAGLARMLHGK